MSHQNTGNAQTNTRCFKENENVNITMENFRKWDGIIFTSEKTSIELDTTVSIVL